MYSNKSLQADNLQAVRFVVSLSLHFTTKLTAYKLRLNEALCKIIELSHLNTILAKTVRLKEVECQNMY